MSNPIQRSPYLRQQRDFPHDDIKELSVQIDKAYIDIASSVNTRTIGVYALDNAIVTGNSFYFSGSSKKQQSLRQIYQFNDATLIQNHGINFNGVSKFLTIYGSFLDASGDWNTLPYVDVVAANNQINIKITSSQIIVTKGSGSPPIISEGLIVIEWISNY